jgi:glycosyltransferase involved in cell wall biosynthesis
MRTLTHVATVNRALESELNGWGVPIPVSTCHDGVDLPAPDESVSSALRASLLAEPGFLVGSVGRLDPQKDYQNFVLAARLVLDKCPNVRFAVAGEGPLRLSLENLIARLGLKGRFHLCGFRPDVVNFLAALDVFVLSSRWEGLPLAVLEAMLLGKPVVATNVGGNAEVIGPPLTGQIVPPADPNALAEAVLKVLDLKNAGMHSPRETRRIAAAFSDPIRNARMLDDIVERLGTSSSCSESCRVWQSDQLPPTLPL